VAIAVDASTPAIFDAPNGNDGTPPSFTPPANSFLVACVTTLTPSGTTVTTSDSLSWSKAIESTTLSAQIWTAWQTTSASRTVRPDDGQGGTGANLVCKTLVLTGVNPNAPIAQTTQGTYATDPVTISAYTSTIDNSFGILVGMHPAANGAATSTDTEYALGAGSHDHITIHKAAVTPTAGTSVTFHIDSSSVTETSVWVAMEVGPPTAPLAPTVTFQAGGHERAGIQWTAGSDGGSAVTDWDIDHATEAAPTTWLGPTATGATNLYGAVTGLTNGTPYVFRVRAVNAIGDGTWSSTSSAATPSDVRGNFLLEDGTSKFLLEDGTSKFLLEAGAGAGGGGITGTSAVTLGSFVPAASGTYTPPPITGTVAVTLGVFTPTASGTYTPPPITGTSAVTLGSFVSAASGTYTPAPITGTAAVTLAAFVPAASGTVSGPGAITGTAAVTLDPFAPAASGTSTPPAFTGTVAVTLDPFTSAASGTVSLPAITGTVAATLGSFVPAASGTVSGAGEIVGTVAVTLGAFVGAASGTRTLPAITGTADVTLGSFTSSAAGTFIAAVTGTSATTLAPFTSSASGTRTLPAITGTVAVTLGPFVAFGQQAPIAVIVIERIDVYREPAPDVYVEPGPHVYREPAPTNGASQ